MTTLDALRQLQDEATPGPWEAEPWPDGAPNADVIAANRDSAGSRQDFMYIAEGLTPANARLIAAAPTHLADLITALEQIERVREVHKPFECRGGCCIECIHCQNEYPCPTIRILDGNE